MKLRIRAHTLRLRLTQTEIKDIENQQAITAQIDFPNNTSLVYLLQPTDLNETKISFKDNTISIELSAMDVETLSSETAVGIQSILATSKKDLMLIVEKDFECLHRDSEEDHDTFPNPSKNEIAE